MISWAVYCHSPVGFGSGGSWGGGGTAAEHWCQKAAYLDGWLHYHLLITGGFWGGFITCTDRGYCYTATVGGQLLSVEGGRGFCFSSAQGFVQYSWAVWASVPRRSGQRPLLSSEGQCVPQSPNMLLGLCVPLCLTVAHYVRRSPTESSSTSTVCLAFKLHCWMRAIFTSTLST